MSTYNCADTQTKVCKLYISEAYSGIARAYNKCVSAERVILRRNILDMLDRVRELLGEETVAPKPEPPTPRKPRKKPVEDTDKDISTLKEIDNG